MALEFHPVSLTKFGILLRILQRFYCFAFNSGDNGQCPPHRGVVANSFKLLNKLSKYIRLEIFDETVLSL